MKKTEIKFLLHYETFFFNRDLVNNEFGRQDRLRQRDTERNRELVRESDREIVNVID